FFSSRRRHTRSDRDWSSDVCSSDLYAWLYRACIIYLGEKVIFRVENILLYNFLINVFMLMLLKDEGQSQSDIEVERGRKEQISRSEERRVGKECRYWRSSDTVKKRI